METVLELEDIHFSYGSVPVLFGVSLGIEPGEVLGLLGTNGAGKSTVLRVLAGLEAPSSGSVTFAGRDVTSTPAEVRCRLGIALVMGGRAVFPDLTVRENLELGGYTVGAELDTRIERELDRFPQLRGRLGNLAGTLSGGEQQQLAIAKALLPDPRLLCIDELSLGLAPTVVADLIAIVRDVNRAGVTCVLVEQSLNLAAELCGRAVFLEKGQVRFEGAPAELLERGDLARAVFLGGAPS
ncbi:MAG: ABC transporter ATP-binding protein [Actinomycetota bacterium]|nr:ABC transporter ATP-binding protein [Actinomycetota bacterium]